MNDFKELRYRFGVFIEEIGKAIADIGAEIQRKCV